MKPFAPAVAVALLWGASIAGLAPEAAPPGLPDTLFPAELVLDQAEAIELSAEQRKAIDGLVAGDRAAARQDAPKRAQIAAELQALLEQAKVDEEAAARLIDLALDLERGERRRNLLQLVRVKNVLSAEQQKALANIRARMVFETGGDR